MADTDESPNGAEREPQHEDLIRQAREQVGRIGPGQGTEDLRAAADARQARHDGAQPTEIGPYKILKVLGKGGMGVVYMAEQTEPRRRVALKVIKPGMDSEAVIARFEVERQALALMDHPNIARVFDAGTTEQGRPYFVMEHVDGLPIAHYCDRQELSIKMRLELFIQVCEAVQHAHQKGVIHRDIKPSNILVSVKDGRATPQIIDFGVAKAIEQPLTEKSFFTVQGEHVGTPAYMSPEQAGPTTDIDTRSDIYSLGVLLYELLTGTLPFDPTSLREAAFDEIRRIIREVEPPKPSTKLSSLGVESAAQAAEKSEPEAQATACESASESAAQVTGFLPTRSRSGPDSATDVAKRRRADPKSLARQIRGDLDWITMMALEKERHRRYATATDFAADVRRHLNNEVVIARPPSATYRAERFVRRNRGLVAAGMTVAALLAAGLVGTSYGLGQAIAAREAEAEQRRMAEESELEALAARDDAEAVTKFLTDMLAAVSPARQGKDVSVRAVLDVAADRIQEEFADRPLIQARLHGAVGWTYWGLGFLDEAQLHLADAAALCHRLKGARHPDALRAASALASVLIDRGNYNAGEARLLATLEIQRRVLGDEHADTLQSMGSLAELYRRQGRYAEAEPLYLKTLETYKRVLGKQHPRTLASMNDQASLYLDQGRYAEAELLYLKTLETHERGLGEQHPRTLTSMNNLAGLYLHQGRYSEAEPLLLRTLDIRERVLGAGHPDTLSSMGNLAGLYDVQGRDAEAEALFLKTYEVMKRVLGEEHAWTLKSMNNLAVVYHRQGRYAEAEPLYLRTLDIRERVLGAGHPNTLGSMNNLAGLYNSQGRYAEAEPLCLRTLDIERRVLGEEHPDTLRSMLSLAALYYNQGRNAEAEPLAAQAVAMAQQALSPEHPDLAGYRSTYGQVLLKLGRLEEAEHLLLGSYAVLSAGGNMREQAGKVAQALVELYEARHEAEPDIGYDAKAAEWRAKLPATDPKDSTPANGDNG